MAISSFSALFDAIQQFRGGRWVFRGVKDSEYTLTPSIGRTPYSDREQRIFAQFVRELPAYSAYSSQNDWELLAVAQHHGLPTRLLDWTENPLVAAFFASDSPYERDGTIFAMKTANVVKDFNGSPFAVDKIMRYRPRHINPRIRAQHGLFSIHPDPTKPVPVGKFDGGEVQRIDISTRYKSQLQWDLARFGADRSLLFPDVDGLASHIKWMNDNYEPSMAPND